jgi:hypothetical protein
MLVRAALGLFLAASATRAVIVDQVAIVVGNSIVKDSDIDRNIRVTRFLNSEPLDFSRKTKKETANRLIDQIFIRREVQLGDYPVATWEQATQEVDQIVNKKFANEASLQDKLKGYGIVEPDLVSHFQWQLTVLRFIDARFKPAALVTERDISDYYREHQTDFRREHPGHASLEQVRGEINDFLASQQVDKLLFAWLDEQRKEAKIKYYEESLR